MPDISQQNKVIDIIVDNVVRIKNDSIPQFIQDRLKERLIILNPQWIENDKRGYWNGNTPKHLRFLKEENNFFVMPRGFVNRLVLYIKEAGYGFKLDDKTRLLPEVMFRFNGDLYDYQTQAANDILKKRFGVFNCPTGGGKTVVALFCIAKRQQPSLVIVHTKELLYQWRDRSVQFLGLEADEIGLIGDGNMKIGERLTIAIVKSVYKCAEELRNKIGFLIIDECHRTPSKTFIDAASVFDSRYMLGLSATPYRRDKLTEVIHFYMGNTVCDIQPESLQRISRIMKAKVEVRMTEFEYRYINSDDYQPMIQLLVDDFARNKLIVTDVIAQTLKDTGISLVLSDRKEHCHKLFDLIRKADISVSLLTGDISSNQRKIIIEQLQSSQIKVLVATAQLIGEGFDLKQLSSLFLCMPVKFTGRLKQYVGRILRTDSGKQEAIIYDYVDQCVVLQAAYKTRIKAYRELGITEIVNSEVQNRLMVLNE